MSKPKKKEYELEVYFPEVPSDLEEVLKSQGFERNGELSEREIEFNFSGCWKRWKGEKYICHEHASQIFINYFTTDGSLKTDYPINPKERWCELPARLIVSIPCKRFTQEAMEKQEEVGRILRDRYHALLYDPQFKMEVED